jgi:hypothetical protein
MARVEMDGAGLAALKAEILRKVEPIPLAIGIDAEAMAAVRTGAMKASIKVDVREQSAGHWRISAGAGLPDARVIYNEYGTHNEDGSVRMHEQPFMRPAAFQKRAL